eukprot:3821634-Rhodomonas_salina.1
MLLGQYRTPRRECVAVAHAPMSRAAKCTRKGPLSSAILYRISPFEAKSKKHNNVLVQMVRATWQIELISRTDRLNVDDNARSQRVANPILIAAYARSVPDIA